MCDYSLTAIKSRPAKVGDKLVSRNFNTGTTGLAELGGDCNTAVCLRPGTEVAFDEDVIVHDKNLGKVARFREINTETERMHHDAFEFADGTTQLVTYLPNIKCTVLQLGVDEKKMHAEPVRPSIVERLAEFVR